VRNRQAGAGTHHCSLLIKRLAYKNYIILILYSCSIDYRQQCHVAKVNLLLKQALESNLRSKPIIQRYT